MAHSSLVFLSLALLLVVCVFAAHEEEEEDEAVLAMVKKSLAVGRMNFRPGKRSLAMARPGFRPGKRSLAVGRMNYRPGKRSTVASSGGMCKVGEMQTRMKVMDVLYDELQMHWDDLNDCMQLVETLGMKQPSHPNY